MPFLASGEAFSAAATGQQAAVKEFIDEYPTLKNKSSLWGTTLLYTAAVNNQFEIVKYLVGKVHCAVNARNWRNVNVDQSPSAGHTQNPTPGSTALHGACSNSHLRIVEYLVIAKKCRLFYQESSK